jgi:hypothetical protein
LGEHRLDLSFCSGSARLKQDLYSWRDSDRFKSPLRPCFSYHHSSGISLLGFRCLLDGLPAIRVNLEPPAVLVVDSVLAILSLVKEKVHKLSPIEQVILSGPKLIQLRLQLSWLLVQSSEELFV